LELYNRVGVIVNRDLAVFAVHLRNRNLLLLAIVFVSQSQLLSLIKTQLKKGSTYYDEDSTQLMCDYVGLLFTSPYSSFDEVEDTTSEYMLT
jgi:hypothetical protein